MVHYSPRTRSRPKLRTSCCRSLRATSGSVFAHWLRGSGLRVPTIPIEPEARAEGSALDRRRLHEQALFVRLAAGDERVRGLLVERFLPLAHAVALRYQRSSEPFDDLFQVASLGLVKAIDRFDPVRGCAFSSFAVPTIVGEIKRYFRDYTWTVRPPRGLQESSLLVEKAMTQLTRELDRAPTTSELAAAANVGEEQLLAALHARRCRSALSLQSPLGDADGSLLQDTIGADDLDLETIEARAMLDHLLRFVPPRTRAILCMRFQQDMTQIEVGEAVGISQMQVSRILRHGLEQLRAATDEHTRAACVERAAARRG